MYGPDLLIPSRVAPRGVRIPSEAGRVFRFQAGHRTEMKAAEITNSNELVGFPNR
jgi:hypothetical protein